MCLQNEEMAKKIVPAFGRLLATDNEDPAIKNNIVYALSDMMLVGLFSTHCKRSSLFLTFVNGVKCL